MVPGLRNALQNESGSTSGGGRSEGCVSVRQADLVIGNDYARSSSAGVRYAARVTVVVPPRAGKVTVKVVDPGPRRSGWGTPEFRKGQKVQVTTASIICPWEEHSALVEAEDRKQAEAAAEFERREEERLAAERPDPDRRVERDYEPEYEWDPLNDREGAVELAAVLSPFLSAFRSVSPAEAVELLGDLPVKVRRDIVAALGDATLQFYGESRVTSAAVRDVFSRSASMIRRVGIPRGSGRDLESPDVLLRAYDAEFFSAITDVAVAQGQVFRPPFVPALPAWLDDELSVPSRSMLAALGWVRVAIADTGGRKLHRLGCSVTRSGNSDRNLRTVETMAWWEVALAPSNSRCGVCGGPAVLHGIEFAHFVAAADAWEARGRETVEAWQVAAVGRLIAATTRTRMREGHFDVTLSSRVWDALSAEAPGHEGWDAYHLVNQMWWATKGLSAEQLEHARVLAVRRLNQLLAVLPETQRLIELPAGAGQETVVERYRALSKAHGERIAELDRALFSLKDAMAP